MAKPPESTKPLPVQKQTEQKMLLYHPILISFSWQIIIAQLKDYLVINKLLWEVSDKNEAASHGAQLLDFVPSCK